MATEYKIIFTYTGQDNTSGSRSVARSKFKKTGDTGRKIGQIKSITYEHWHTSDKAANWALRGRLVFSDGTSITSNTVTHTISGTKVKYTNTFTKLPTPEQFALLKAVQTLDSKGKTTADGYSAKLYWRANSDNPMRLIVTFIEEQPVVYAPKVDSFSVVRTDASGNPSREGLYIRTSLKLSIGNSAGLSGASCKIYYAADAQPVVGVSQSIDLTSKISSLMTGISNDPNILTGVWNVGNTWFFTAVFATGEEAAVSEVMHVERGTTSMHISGEPGGGVCIGGFSTGTTANPKFESRPPARFYSGIDGVTNYFSEEMEIGRWIDGKPVYRAIGEMAWDVSVVNQTLPTPSGVYVTRFEAYARSTGGTLYPLPTTHPSGVNYSIRVGWSPDIGFLFSRGSVWNAPQYSIYKYVVIYEYTKNTD